MSNYIYLLDLTKINKIKIGSTKFPISRLNSYQSNFPFNVKYLKLYKVNSYTHDCYQVEKLIKENFKSIISNDCFFDEDKISNLIIENFLINNKINFESFNIKDCNYESFDEYKIELLMKSN